MRVEIDVLCSKFPPFMISVLGFASNLPQPEIPADIEGKTEFDRPKTSAVNKVKKPQVSPVTQTVESSPTTRSPPKKRFRTTKIFSRNNIPKHLKEKHTQV